MRIKKILLPIKYLIPLIIIVLLLSACAAPSQVVTPQIAPVATEDMPSIEDTATALPEPEKALTVCTSTLPGSLFLYDGVQTPIKENLLAMTLEAPFERINGELLPNILVKTPSLSDGDLRLEPAAVQRGQTVVDAFGELVVLKPGVVVRPSACRGSDCAVTWDGESELIMDRMVVDFELREDLKWSDGNPVTASDVLFSFKLAGDPEAPGLKWAEDRTEDLLALDSNTIEWIGRPGFTTAELAIFLWRPLPSHLFDDSPPWSSVALSDSMAMASFSYGSFALSSWDASSMVFVSNPHYYRSAEGLPLMDRVTFQAIEGGARAAWEALKSGACDVMDQSFGVDNDPEFLSEIQSDQRFSALVDQGDAWFQMVFGVQPASYDEFYNPVYGDRPDVFGDPRTRQALAACLDRESMINRAVNGMGELWPSFVPPGQSQLSSENQLKFDPGHGNELLAEAGWVDHDNDPQTPLQAWGVPNVPSGTPFSIALLINPSSFHQVLSEIIQSSLSQCGIEVTISTIPDPELYAPGPEGSLFGRSFDLTLLSWMPVTDLDCRYYMSSQIPNIGNNWIGTNIAGFADENYDAACSAAALALPAEQSETLRLSEETYLDALPAVPLFSMPSVLVYSVDICNGSGFDIQSGDFLNRIENLTLDDSCP
jgi:peptide/nickel transport system substrate-binding protein